MPRKPTTKQKLAGEKTLENLGLEHPKTKGEILIESGYKPSVAENPQIVTESAGYKEVINELVPPDSLLAVRLKELINKREVATAFDHESGERIKVVVDQPDTQAVSKGLDMAFKIKGSYAAEKHINANLNIEKKVPLTPEQIEAIDNLMLNE